MQVPKGYAGHALVIELGKKEATIEPLVNSLPIMI